MCRATTRYADRLPVELGEIMKLHYLQGQTWRRIAKDRCLSHAQIRHRLRQAKYLLVALTLQEVGLGEIAKLLA